MLADTARASRRRAGLWVPLSAHGETFGSLRVTTTDGSAVGSGRRAILPGGGADRRQRALHRQASHAPRVTAARVKQQFLGMLSHELRTPLHAILGYSDMLDSLVGDSGDALVRESLDRVRANACRLQGLVDEMLCLAQLRAGEPRRRDRAGQPVRDLHAIRRDHRGAAGGPADHLRVGDRSGRVAWCAPTRRSCDRSSTALLSNAVKFTEKGSISLRARRTPDGDLEIAVRDTGVGIEPQDIDVDLRGFPPARRLADAPLRRAGPRPGAGARARARVGRARRRREPARSAARCSACACRWRPVAGEHERAPSRDGAGARTRLATGERRAVERCARFGGLARGQPRRAHGASLSRPQRR